MLSRLSIRFNPPEPRIPRITTLPPLRRQPPCPPLTRRSLWTSTTSSHPSLPLSLSAHASALQTSAQSTSKHHVALCFVTPHYTHQDLLNLPSLFESAFGEETQLLGCIVSAIGDPQSETTRPGLGVLSIPQNQVKAVFQTESLGRKSKGVGRWPEMNASGSFLTSAGQDKGRGDGWGGFDMSRFSSEITHGREEEVVLPEGLKGADVKKGDVIVTISDSDPHAFLEILDRHYPSTPKFGIVATMTPFSTGLPQTLYSTKKTLSQGLLGLVISPPLEKKLNVGMTNGTLEPFSDWMRITNCRGNVILTLDDAFAARSLLKSTESGGVEGLISGDKELYLEVDTFGSGTKFEVGSGEKVYKIISGDPSKGTIAVDCERDLKVGMGVRTIASTLEFCTKTPQPPCLHRSRKREKKKV
ncbi:hypothetical protein HDV05_004234 [Chytridiales sp. JEL 0842]|nr:hypothetical protein HDV05_004234 [Chytridiales sp. JEL 0842]